MDDDNKVRRNLMVFSTAVVFYWWLGLTPGVIAKRVFGDDAALEMSAVKVWVSIIVVLSYLVWRYVWVVLDSSIWLNAKAAYLTELENRLSTLAVVEFERFKQGGLRRFLKDTPPAGEGREEVRGNIHPMPSIDVMRMGSRGGGFCAWHHVHTIVAREGVVSDVNSPNMHLYVDGWWRIGYSLLNLLSLLKTSLVLQIGFPFALAYLALLVSVNRLAASLIV